MIKNNFIVKDVMFIIRIILYLSLLILFGCAQLPEHIKPELSSNNATQQVELSKANKGILETTGGSSKMSLLGESADALMVRLSLIAYANESIDVQYYIWNSDSVGKLILNALIDAADRGVKVRMLLDDFNLDDEMNRYLLAMDSHDNIVVSLFNPFANRDFHLADYLWGGMRLNRRMHNKSFIADNKIAIVGGRNIGNEYFHADTESNFNDIDVVSTGHSVDGIRLQFNTYWQSDVVYPLSAFKKQVAEKDNLESIQTELAQYLLDNEDSEYAKDIRNSSVYKKLSSNKFEDDEFFRTFTGKVNVLYDDPGKGLGKSDTDVHYLKSKIAPYFENAESSIELISPYFVPGHEGVELMSLLIKKGLKVRVITNSLSSTDGVLPQSGYAKYRYEMLSMGIELYELKATAKSKASKSLKYSNKAKSGLHAKIYILDRKDIFIGSFNFDPRSAEINTEVGVVYEVPEMANLIASEVFDNDLLEHTYQLSLDENNNIIWTEYVHGEKVIYTSDPQTSFWRRTIQALYSILPIESQL